MAARSALGRAPHKTAGGLLLVAGTTIVMGIITAEALYTAAYDARMEISDLGASETGVILQPSSTIFNATMLAAGAMIIAGAWFAHQALHRRAVIVPTGLLGMGVLGVGSSQATSIPSTRCSPSPPLWPAGWPCCCRTR